MKAALPLAEGIVTVSRHHHDTVIVQLCVFSSWVMCRCEDGQNADITEYISTMRNQTLVTKNYTPNNKSVCWNKLKLYKFFVVITFDFIYD